MIITIYVPMPFAIMKRFILLYIDSAITVPCPKELYQIDLELVDSVQNLMCTTQYHDFGPPKLYLYETGSTIVKC